ncbi:hypothetical protein BKA56DRAFT_583705 [Ilyonectria sp. MPI-CAGE-AT-0026]|nr:hypothetical protein BKA56DRAFT_583705 [Ilyonectria sp. MPI-CAGE-AT-0026]
MLLLLLFLFHPSRPGTSPFRNMIFPCLAKLSRIANHRQTQAFNPASGINDSIVPIHYPIVPIFCQQYIGQSTPSRPPETWPMARRGNSV